MIEAFDDVKHSIETVCNGGGKACLVIYQNKKEAVFAVKKETRQPETLSRKEFRGKNFEQSNIAENRKDYPLKGTNGGGGLMRPLHKLPSVDVISGGVASSLARWLHDSAAPASLRERATVLPMHPAP